MSEVLVIISPMLKSVVVGMMMFWYSAFKSTYCSDSDVLHGMSDFVLFIHNFSISVNFD